MEPNSATRVPISHGSRLGEGPFFLPTRKLSEVLGVHWTLAARWLRALEVLGIIYLADGEVRRRGGNRSPRYYCDLVPLRTEILLVPKAAGLPEPSLIAAETRGQ